MIANVDTTRKIERLLEQAKTLRQSANGRHDDIAQIAARIESELCSLQRSLTQIAV